MLGLVFPGGMLFIGIQPPSEHEFRSVLVGFFLRAYGRLDQVGQLTVRLIPAFVGGPDVTGIRLDAGQRRTALALRRLARARLQFLACHPWIDFRHLRTPSTRTMTNERMTN